jgi:hypothetical protein
MGQECAPAADISKPLQLRLGTVANCCRSRTLIISLHSRNRAPLQKKPRSLIVGCSDTTTVGGGCLTNRVVPTGHAASPAMLADRPALEKRKPRLGMRGFLSGRRGDSLTIDGRSGHGNSAHGKKEDFER